MLRKADCLSTLSWSCSGKVMPSCSLKLRCFLRHFTRGKFTAPIAVLVFLGGGFPSAGQEALRASLAGQEAVEARKRALANPHYNLKIRALRLRFWTGLATEFTDNVNLTEANDKRADLSLRPEFHVAALWPVTEKNALTLSLGVGYRKYLRTSKLNYFFVTPDTDLAFDIYAGDFLINLHNRFVLSQEAYIQPEISRTGDFGYFEDTAGVQTTWDLNKLILNLGYDHDLYFATTPQFSYRDHSSELLTASAGLVLNSTTLVGLELGGGLTTYDTRPTYISTTNVAGTTTNVARIPNGYFLSNQKSVNFGPFLRAQLSKHLGLKLAAGYTLIFLDTPTATAADGNINAFYADITLNHVVNNQLKYAVSAGRQIQLGIFSDTLDLYHFRLQPAWNLVRNVSLLTPIFFEHAELPETPNTKAESLNRYGAGLELSYRLTQKLEVSTSYNFLLKQSNLPQNGYIQNRLVLDLRYSF